MLRQQNPSDVDVAITPEELEGLDETSIQALYNQRVAEERARNAREVCSVLCGHVMMFNVVQDHFLWGLLAFRCLCVKPISPSWVVVTGTSPRFWCLARACSHA